MKKLLLAAICALACGGAVAEQWHVVTVHKTNELIWFIDKSSMECEGKICQAWIAEINRKKDRDYITALELYEADCKKMRARILSSSGYSAGNRVHTWDGGDWEYYAPGTIADTVVKTICKKYPLSDEKIFKGSILDKERDVYKYLATLGK